MRKHLRGWVVAVTAAVLCAGCATGPATPPGHEAALPFQLARVQEQTRDGVIVHLVIPTEEEVAAHFGAGFAEHGIALPTMGDSTTSMTSLPRSNTGRGSKTKK